ncbi:MAG: type II secretion system protein [Candidatus Daviesbacteria bacterium]|nr:type II secretion system protein [Candidatus Daviesbacteria bacterium]
MKKLLPNFIRPHGFTLIELMVVVAIIAILAVIGFAIFQNAQKNARDGIRRGEINNLSKSIESSRDPTLTTGYYIYNAANFTADYPTHTPKDPRKDAARPKYCVSTSNSATNPFTVNPTIWSDPTVCPSGGPAGSTAYAAIVSESGVYQTIGNALAGAGGARHWEICALLEVPTGANSIFCISNSQ